jgi:Family of unknown function (DUF5677)
MPFSTQGFLSPELEKFRTALRGIPAYRAWFEFGDDLNRLGHEMLDGLDVPLDDNQRLTIAGLFVRAHKSLQAALTLAEMGLVGDARAVLRSAVEGAIALNALVNDATFLDQLIEAHQLHQRKRARLVLSNPDYRSIYTVEQIVQMEATINEVDAKEAAVGRKLMDINWADTAFKHCKDLYDLLYRLLSSDGTHTTIDSINRVFGYGAVTKRINELKVGPDIAGLVETLKSASLMFLWAADPFARIYNQETGRLHEMMRRFTGLPQDEPDATVVAGF